MEWFFPLATLTVYIPIKLPKLSLCMQVCMCIRTTKLGVSSEEIRRILCTAAMLTFVSTASIQTSEGCFITGKLLGYLVTASQGLCMTKISTAFQLQNSFKLPLCVYVGFKIIFFQIHSSNAIILQYRGFLKSRSKFQIL